MWLKNVPLKHTVYVKSDTKRNPQVGKIVYIVMIPNSNKLCTLPEIYSPILLWLINLKVFEKFLHASNLTPLGLFHNCSWALSCWRWERPSIKLGTKALYSNWRTPRTLCSLRIFCGRISAIASSEWGHLSCPSGFCTWPCSVLSVHERTVGITQSHAGLIRRQKLYATAV